MRLSVVDANTLPVDRIGQRLAFDAELVPVMPASEFDARARNRPEQMLEDQRIEVVYAEHHGYAALLGDCDHPLRDRIAAVGEQHIGPINLYEPGEESQDCPNLVRAFASRAGLTPGGST